MTCDDRRRPSSADKLTRRPIDAKSPFVIRLRPLAQPAFSLSLSLYSFITYRARQLYKNISMLFLFPVKDGKLSTGVNATFDASCYG